MVNIKRTLVDSILVGGNPYSVPRSSLNVAKSRRAEWTRDETRNATAVVRLVLTCAWATLSAFLAAHCTVYWFLTERPNMLLEEWPGLTLFVLLLIPLVILLPSRIYVHRCRRNLGVAAFLNKWETRSLHVFGRPLLTSLIWVLGLPTIVIVWEGVLKAVLFHNLSLPSKDWLLSMVVAIPVAFAVSLAVCRLASRNIGRRLSELAYRT